MSNEYRGTNRRDLRTGRESDIVASEWPVTTLRFYKGVLKEVADSPEAELNMKMVRLCETRAKMTHLVLALKNARQLWKDEARVEGKLGLIELLIEQAVKDYPLEIRNR